ncbi:hypothetical protein HU200_008692 [Digitaria exilis]|uniref:Ubiquitin-like protease family profile domain-containing protein n=1 Tax=Digitaria exilis TaxID=1010633 RepID=A0A835FMC1_9POAL|nr:hypothetical protein HU200_008692 [Digitaria exilis]
MMCNDTVASLKDKDGNYFRLRQTLTYLGHDMVFFPINVTKNHWYLVVVNVTKRAVQVLDSLGSTTR